MGIIERGSKCLAKSLKGEWAALSKLESGLSSPWREKKIQVSKQRKSSAAPSVFKERKEEIIMMSAVRSP